MKDNILLMTDSYKFTHWKQYPPKTEKVFSYLESRGGDFDEVVFFGLQYLLKKYLAGKVVTKEKIDEAEAIVTMHLGNRRLFNRAGWEYILDKYEGRLPVRIKAVPEGTPVPVSNALMTIENTDPNCFWLTNYLETLLVQVWYPCTVATLSRNMKGLIASFLEKTGDAGLVDFKLHDFGYRGVSSHESAAIGGAAHLLNFKGTDTAAGLILARDYYREKMAGFSIPAAEHSTITSWGKDNEALAYENMLTQFDTGLVAVVSDSYDIYSACESIWGGTLKDKVMERDGLLVVRPDSGFPPTVVCRVLDILGEKIGYEVNEKGFKVLHPKVRVIQGDGIDLTMTELILTEMAKNGWSADNIAFGMGGALLQKLNRDTQKFAFKCSSVTVGGMERDVFKQPVDCAWKKSKAGRLKLVKMLTSEGPGYATVREDEPPHTHMRDAFEEVFLNGDIIKEYSFEECRENASF